MSRALAQDQLRSVGEVLRHRRDGRPEQDAYTYLDSRGEESRVTAGGLDAGGRAIAAELIARQTFREPVLMLYPSGLDFIRAFIGCLYSGAVAVPAYPPRRNRSLHRVLSIVRSCKARIVLTTSEVKEQIAYRFAEEPVLAGAELVATDTLGAASTLGAADTLDAADTLEAAATGVASDRLDAIRRDDIAFLQYTSGSTSDPKGVIVTHDNLLHNLEMLKQVNRYQGGDVLVSWLPFFHDMGLIGYILETLYLGGHCVLMEPSTFARRPVRWLDAISRFRAVASGGPNFGYDLCLGIAEKDLEGIDLSSWSIAHNAAEPVRHETMEAFARRFEPSGFRADAFFPAYGLAEATVFVSGTGGKPPVFLEVDSEALAHGRVQKATSETTSAQTLVGCGTTRWLDQEVRIVDPASLEPLPAYRVGEVWASGSHIGAGYWGLEAQTEATFGATVPGCGDRRFLRTGDLGFMDPEGELFITGRMKDLLIFHGLNHYPQDIELTVEHVCPDLVRNATIAFAIPGTKGIPRLCIAAEVERTRLRKIDFEAAGQEICRAIAEHHDLGLHHILFLKPNSNPKTSSGKVQRARCRQLYEQDDLRAVAEWPDREASAARAAGSP